MLNHQHNPQEFLSYQVNKQLISKQLNTKQLNNKQLNTKQLISKQLNHKQTNYPQSLHSLLPIFKSSDSPISIIQLNLAYQILHHIPFFYFLEKYSSPQIIKIIIKYGKLLQLTSKRLICQKDSPMNYFIACLYGSFGIIDGNNQKLIEINGQEKFNQFFEEFKSFSTSYLQFLKKKQQSKTHKSYRTPKINNISQQQIHTKINSPKQHQFICMGEKTLKNKSQQRKFSHSIITLSQQNYIFIIDFKRINELMREQYNKDLTKQMSIFSTFSCFGLFKKEVLRQIVEASQKILLKKNDILFRQGDEDNRIFLLKSGEIILQKMIVMNRQNPNQLYKNRLYIKRQSYGNKLTQKIQSIPFADFTKVYNSTSTKKKVKLTSISSICILGEEEIIAKKTTRQTTAKVTSTQAQVYVLTLSLIQKIIPSNSNFTIQDFLKILEQQITNKKILYRQSKLGNDILYFNKTNNKNGFYLQNQHNKLRSLQKRTSTINNTLTSQTIPVMHKRQSINNNGSQQDINKLFITASFTCHNFQDFYHTFQQQASTQLKQQQHQQLLQLKQKDNQHSQIKYTIQEKEIIKLLHSNQLSNSANRKRKLIRSQNHTLQSKIDLERPLFSSEYFRTQVERSRKIQKDLRKSKLQCLYSKSTQSVFLQSRKYKTFSNSMLVNSKQKSLAKRNLSSQK